MKTLKYILILFYCMFVLSAEVSAQVYGSYITNWSPAYRNGGFELDPDANGDHWPWHGFLASYLTDTSVCVGGSHAQSFIYSGPTMMGIDGLSAYHFYEVSFWARGNTADTVTLRVAVGDQAPDLASNDDTTLAQTGTYKKVGAYHFTGFKTAICTSDAWSYFHYPITECSDYVTLVPGGNAFQFILRTTGEGVILDNVTVREVYPRRFYVDATLGNDSASGVTPTLAWKTMNKVNHKTLNHGDTISFKRGETFTIGELSKPAGWTGTADSGIVINAYGTGNAPILYGDFTGSVWTNRGDGIWATYCGRMYDGSGYEDSLGTWNGMTLITDECMFYLSDADSLSKFLGLLTPSSWGTAITNGTWDTVYVKTWDGNEPNVRIFRVNQLGGSYLTVRDLEFRNWKMAVHCSTGTNNIFRNLKIKNNRYIGIYLNQASDCIVDSCRVDSCGYDAYYSAKAHGNVFRYDTAICVNDTILGTVYSLELAGIGFESDTGCVAEYCYFSECQMDGLAGYYNINDTVRYCTFNDMEEGGIYLNGQWACHNNTVETFGTTQPAIDIVCHGGTSRITYNTITARGYGLRMNATTGGGVAIANHNDVTGLHSTTELSKFHVAGMTSTYNNFHSPGRFSDGEWPNEVAYATLDLFKAEGYEECSSYDGEGGCEEPPAPDSSIKYLQFFR